MGGGASHFAFPHFSDSSGGVDTGWQGQEWTRGVTMGALVKGEGGRDCGGVVRCGWIKDSRAGGWAVTRNQGATPRYGGRRATG